MTVTRPNAGDVLAGGDAQVLEELVVHFVPPEVGRHPVAPSDVEAADWTARHWTSVEPDPLDPGSAAHKRAICAMFQETFNPYRPSVIAWPTLSPDELRRLQSLPIWDIAVQTEGRARLSFAAYANWLDDAEIRSAIMLNAWEENRHKEVLSHMVRAYGIELAEEPPYLPPRNREFAFLVTGYSESIKEHRSPRAFRAGQAIGFLSGRARRDVLRTGHPGGMPPHPVLRQLAGVAPCQPPVWWPRLCPGHLVELRIAAAYWVYIAGLRIGLARSAAWAPTQKSGVGTASTSP